MITILAGGTGSVKLVRGVASQTRDINVIANVGDNYWLYGLYVCPDIDTILYGLGDLLDNEKGWGIKKDTYGFLRQMEMLGEETWFKIGDRDAAIHLMRTNMLKNGKNLTDITTWMCQKFAIDTKIIPVTDNTVETRIVTNKGELHLQEYWVKYRGQDNVEGIKYLGADKARANPAAVNAIHDANLVIIAPGNPLTSIGPILSIKGIKKELSKSKRKVVVVSPLVGNKAISGPATKYMEAAGMEVSPYGLAKMYSEVASHMVIDSSDRLLTRKIQNLDMHVYETKIKMKDKSDEDALASFILKQVHV
ncbi:MAG: 2-phospho-L-lactate transferase [Nitrosopumilaceae archaeon]